MINFRSQAAKRVISFFFLNPSESAYTNELARALDLEPKNLHRKLVEFEKEGLLSSEFRGKQRYGRIESRSDFGRTFLSSSNKFCWGHEKVGSREGSSVG